MTDTELDALVARLRDYKDADCDLAAAAIAALRAELAHNCKRETEVSNERHALRREVKDRQAIEIHLRAEVEVLRKDAEQWRELRQYHDEMRGDDAAMKGDKP